MNVTSSTTGLISSAGIGSGLDVTTIVKAMVDAEKQPLNDLQANASRMQTKLSALGSVKSYLSSFRDAVGELSRPAVWNATASSSNNAAAVSISTENGAATGAYSVEVTRLASAQTLVSARSFGTSEALGAGTLSIQKTSGGAAVDVAVDAGDTLANVRDKINAADSGITAHIQSDSNGSRLVLQSARTGADEGFKVSASGGSSALAALAYDPAASDPAALQRRQSGSDAAATINGVEVVSSSNTLANVLDGITLTLGAVTTTPATLTVTRDTDAIKNKLTGMVTAYNALQNYLATQTKYDASTKTAATLQGDSATNGIRNQLRSLVAGSSGASTSFSRLSDVGFNVQKDGSITLDDAKLAKGLGQTDELRKLFANSDTAVTANNGLAVQLRKMTDSMLGTDGVLTTRTSGIQSSISANSKRQADMQTRIDQYEARVRKQYTALDTKMSSLNSLSAYVTQQITQMNRSTN